MDMRASGLWLAVVTVTLGCASPPPYSSVPGVPASGQPAAPKRVRAAFMSDPPSLNNSINQTVADGKTYQVSDQKAAAEHIGHEVVVSGTLDKDTIKVDKIVAATKVKA